LLSWCFGCQRGGCIYDLASLLGGGTWGRDPRGEAFKTARELVAAALGLAALREHNSPARELEPGVRCGRTVGVWELEPERPLGARR
jgi:hypothetical protein